MARSTLLLLLALAPLTLVAAEPPTKNPDPSSLDVPADTDRAARELVRKLGSREFEDREQASRDLRDLGRLALPALLDGYEHSPLPEVVERCDQLLPRARHLDVRARVDCFVADADGKYQHDLPAAKEFFAVTGRTEASRVLFRDLLLSPNRDLLTAVGGPQEEVAQRAAVRRGELLPQRVLGGGGPGGRSQVAAVDAVALLFVESTVPERLLTAASSAAGVAPVPTALTNSPAFRSALESDSRREPMTAIAVKWFETREEPRSRHLGMTSAATLKLPVAATLAKGILGDKNSTPLYKAQAACNIAKVGSAADADALAPLLKDDTQVTAGVVMVVNGVQQRSPVQVRDVALAMTLLLTKQDPADYGLKARYSGSSADTLRFSYLNYHFDDAEGTADEQRAEAFKKWDEWKAKTLKADAKKDGKK